MHNCKVDEDERGSSFPIRVFFLATKNLLLQTFEADDRCVNTRKPLK